MWPKTLIKNINGACFTEVCRSQEHEKDLNKKGYFQLEKKEKKEQKKPKKKSKKG